MTHADDPWKRLQNHRWILIGGWLGFLPYGMLVVAAFRFLGLSVGAAPLLIVPYAIVWLVNGIAISFFCCPRCRNRFTWRKNGLLGGYANAFTKRCLNCGQRAYETIDPAPVETVPLRLY